MLGLANLAPGPFRGMLFRYASISIVVWDANLFSFSSALWGVNGLRRSLVCVGR